MYRNLPLTVILKVLIQRGAGIELRSKYVDTPLYIAAYSGHSDVVRSLIGSGNTRQKTTKDTLPQEVFECKYGDSHSPNKFYCGLGFRIT